jgi:hypothetical protein
MREEIENILFNKLKSELPPALREMLVRGHTTDARMIPYISIDVGEIKPFGDLTEEDGIFEAGVSIAIADSAHAIRYYELFKRIREVINVLHEFKYESGTIVINALWYDGDSDARDENNVGTVLTYRAIVQFL